MPNRPQPVLHPGTGEPIGPDDLAPLFPMELILQEVSQDAEVPVPEAVRDVYRLWRPTPLYRAHRLERELGTRSRIFYKYEGVSPAGSHKPNTAVAQAYYVKESGRARISTETGAGQWGSAVSLASKLFGLECKVYMVKVSYEQKPYRRSMMETWGASVVASPSEDTQSGRAILEADPGSPGSLGIAISEAVEDAAQREDTAYSLGSVLNHVLMHQTVIGQEAIAQMEDAGAFPDLVAGCAEAARTSPACRSRSCARRSPDATSTCSHANRLRARRSPAGRTPTTSATRGSSPRSSPCTRSATTSSRPESTPAGSATTAWRRSSRSSSSTGSSGGGLRADRRLRLRRPVRPVRGDHPGARGGARRARRHPGAAQADEEGRERTILFNLSGHGHFDLGAYDAYLHGKLEDFELPEEEIARALAAIEPLPKPAVA